MIMNKRFSQLIAELLESWEELKYYTDQDDRNYMELDEFEEALLSIKQELDNALKQKKELK
jgi:hypothetical protein